MAKDSARSWLVLTVALYFVFLEVGLIKSFSVLLPDIKEQFATDTWVLGLSVSINVGWGSALGKVDNNILFMTHIFATLN